MSSSLPTPSNAPTATALTTARVAFVGAGPGDLGLLTVRAREYLAAADVVILDTLHVEEQLRGFTRADADFVDGSQLTPTGRLRAQTRGRMLVRTAEKLAKKGEALIVRLMDGDAASFSNLAREAGECHDAGVPFEIVPGVSTAASVASYAGIPLTDGAGTSLHVVQASDDFLDWNRSVDPHVTVVVIGDLDHLCAAMTGLLDAGRDPQTPVSLTAHGTTVTQNTHTTVLDDALEALKREVVPEVSVAVVGQPVAWREQLSWWETKPLFGWNVLVPRTREQAGTMTDRLEAYGASAEVVPTISVQPPRTPQQMDRAVNGLVTGRYEWIGFTSANAVKAVREKFDEYGLDARAFAGLKIAAVGGVTAEALNEWGLQPDLIPTGEQSARGLLEDWPEYDEVLDPIDRVFLPRADIATEALVAGLKDRGWEVDDITAYRTVRATPPPAPVREAIKAGKFDAVCFTSSSTVRNLVGIAGKPHTNTVVACIGPATAAKAEEHGLRVDVVAPEPRAEALVDALADFARARNADLAEEYGAIEAVPRPSEVKPRRSARTSS